MKKNLRNILTLALGFVTVIATAQSWDADSRTRVDMGGDNDQFTTDQRTSLGVSWGGNGWGINVSANHNYDLGTAGSSMSWNEAYATTDLMGYASVAVGRQALDYGSGSIMGSNDWGSNPNTHDGGVFSIANDMLGLDLGVYKNNDGGVDDYFSMEPNEFKDMVDCIRIIESAIGNISYGPTKSENIGVKNRRSLFVVKDIRKGEVISHDNVRSIRPGHGLEPKYIDDALGMKAKRDLSKGTPLQWDIIE